jgi:hypothetical protein
MSANAKLDEIDASVSEAEFRAMSEGDQKLLATGLFLVATRDRALLSRIVRMVAEAPCEGHRATAMPAGVDCPERWVAAAHNERLPAAEWCWPCRVRRELGGGR